MEIRIAEEKTSENKSWLFKKSNKIKLPANLSKKITQISKIRNKSGEPHYLFFVNKNGYKGVLQISLR
jgi:hypothetical protein